MCTRISSSCTNEIEWAQEQIISFKDHVTSNVQYISNIVLDVLNQAYTDFCNSLPSQEEIKKKYETIRAFLIEKSITAKDYIEEKLGVDLYEGAKQLLNTAAKVGKAALATLFFLSNSSVFVMGAIAGIAATDTMRTIHDSITQVWTNLNPVEKAVVISAGLIAWPISLAAGAFFAGSGSAIYLKDRATQRTSDNQPQMPYHEPIHNIDNSHETHHFEHGSDNYQI